MIKYTTKNRCYTNASIIHPKYIVVHSTGCAIGTCDEMYKRWNKASASTCAHGCVDAEKSYQVLPLNYHGWHVGAKGNSTTVGFEITEPKNIKYKSGAAIDTLVYSPNDRDNISDFYKRYNNAVELCVNWCRELNIDVDHVKSHSEMFKLGKATNHADVEHWFSLFGVSMDDFRADVKEMLSKEDFYNEVKTTPEKILTVKDVQNYVGASPDGIFGNKTKKAIIKKVQNEIGVSSDGIFGVNTRKAFPNVKKSSKYDELAKLIQCMLICKKWSVGSCGADGYFGNDTLNAVKDFQKSKNLSVDGIVGKNTAGKLFI